jgi:CubicO group peptidase (beta-lactamase class C family)
MPAIAPEVDPSEVGLDQARLTRIERHFGRYVDDRRLPGFLVVVTRRGKVAYVACRGFRDLENALPVEVDTRFRIYSMTKPITSVAAMICYEEGLIALDDPLAKFVPEFAETRVFSGGSSLRPVTVPMSEPIRIWHLMTHTAGLTYGWMYNHPVDAMYRSAGFEWKTPGDLDLGASCSKLAKLPLRCQPGSEWNYSVATDVLGRVVEVASGQSFDSFLAERVFGPLGMNETSFYVEGAAAEQLAVLYSPDLATGRAARATYLGEVALHRPNASLGGSGLVSTAADYHRFTQMLLGRGQLEGVRVLGARTVAYMTRNHLPGGAELASFGNPIGEEAEAGLGFGLGFSVVTDPASMRVSSSAGEYGWGGAASTVFWVDPVEEMTVLFFTQLLPSTTYPIRRQLKQLAFSALVD